MKWLPHHRFEIRSPLDTGVALAALASHTEPENWFRFTLPNSANDERFEGQISGEAFHLRRVVGYRNSFLPVIDGTVGAARHGSVIQVRMRMFWFVYAFLAVWTMGALIMLASAGDVGLIAGPLFLLFAYLMAMGGFWFEASRQEQTLRSIFKAG